MTNTTPCGGCGATSEDQRCIGCWHDFTPGVFTWARRKTSLAKGYEVSSGGDSRFSALYAIMHDGRTLEMHYQCDVKGFDIGGTNWRLGKGRKPINGRKPDDLWAHYLDLWRTWAADHPDLMRGLRAKVLTSGSLLTDRYATTDINQARALSILLTEMAE